MMVGFCEGWWLHLLAGDLTPAQTLLVLEYLWNSIPYLVIMASARYYYYHSLFE